MGIWCLLSHRGGMCCPPPHQSVTEGEGGTPPAADITHRKSGCAASGTPAAASGSGTAAFASSPALWPVLAGDAPAYPPAKQEARPERGCT